MLSKEDAENAKLKIIEHIKNSFPEEKKKEAIEKISSMSSEALEEFLNQNNLIVEGNQQCIFCLIVSGKIPSYKIAESENSLAVLEINPSSKGHSIVIQKIHSKDGKISSETKKFAGDISKALKKKLKAQKIISSENHLFKHGVINLIPSYSKEETNQKRTPAKKEELESIQKIILEPEKKKISSKTSKKPEKLADKRQKKLWLPRRIP